MSIDMNRNYVKLLMDFRRQDLPAFISEHERLFADAKKSGDHLEVTSHYYSVMSKVINDFFGGNFHFAPPNKKDCSLDEALVNLHRTVAKKLELGPDVKCLDLGCGIGGVMRDIADFGADLTGITIAANEADMGNTELKARGLDNCRLVHGDIKDMHMIESASQDAAYAIYSLKYIPELDSVFSEVNRVLRPGGKFLIYDLIKTDNYDEENEEHRQVVEGLEFACGMPSLHKRREMIELAEKAGLELIEEEDLQHSLKEPFHYCFSHSPLFMWLVRSPVVDSLISVGEFIRLLPQGFGRFNRIFLSGTVEKIVSGGERGILSGSKILVFRKRV